MAQPQVARITCLQCNAWYNSERELRDHMRTVHREFNSETVDDGGMKYPSWQVPLQNVIVESDSERLHQRIQVVEVLIFARFQQLRQESDAQNELDAINDAFSILRKIKHERFGYHGPK